MKNFLQYFFAAAAASVALALPALADNMATVAITPATGVVTLTPHWAIGSGLAGFHLMTQDVSLGGGANQFYSIIGANIPAGGNVLAFNHYIAASGAATPSNDIGSKLTPNAYSALTSSSPDVGYGAVNFYTIHHTVSADYFTTIIPGSGTSSAVTDLKPMSGPGGPSTLGASGYFSLTFAATDLGYGADYFYYLRTDSVTGFARFGIMNPALLGTSTDEFNLGRTGYTMMTYTGTDVGFGVNLMYYLRLDPITGFTILGTLNPLSGATADVANLGSVYSNLDFVVGDVGFGANNFYATGAINPTGQTVSFAAQINRAISGGSFTVAPSASSALPVTLTVVPGSVGAASISGPVGGVFTVTPTAPGLITLQATQAGQAAPAVPAFEYNMLRQSFTITGAAIPVITNSSLSAAANVNSPFTYTIAASGSPTSYTASPLPLGLSIASGTGVISGTPSATGVINVILGATNVNGTGNATLVITVAPAGVAPIITNTPLTVGGTVGTSFSYAIVASGLPVSYSATPLPPGLVLTPATGIISGIPTTVGITPVLLGATNGVGTGNATLTIGVAAAGVAPIIVNNPLAAAGTVGTPFGYTISASGVPTSFTASPLPAGLSLVSSTGVITGTPTAAGITTVYMTASNISGTGTATLVITVASAGVAPVFASNTPTAAGTTGAPFSYVITAATSGLPTTYTAAPLPAGLTIVGATGVITGIPTTAGTTVVNLTAQNAAGISTATLTVTVAPAAIQPVITSPGTASGTAGSPFPPYLIVSTGLPTSYSATGLPAGLTLNPLTGAITGIATTAGLYPVVLSATNSAGTTTITLTITVLPIATVTPPPYSRIVNFSLRALSGPGAQSLVMGFIVQGTGKDLLVRGIGPTLAAFGVTGYLVAPGLTLYSGNTLISSNSGWGTNASGASQAAVISSTELQVGAFALPAGSLDAALLATLNQGAYTAIVLGANGATGVALAEVYDTDAVIGPKLINVSARMSVGTGNDALLAGFVIAGNTPKTVLVRGVGPTLAAFGVTGFMTTPQITVFQNGTALATNLGWGTGTTSAAQLSAAAAQVGAFPLPLGSADSALLITLPPGLYSVQLSGGSASTGIALIEIYDVM